MTLEELQALINSDKLPLLLPVVILPALLGAIYAVLKSDVKSTTLKKIIDIVTGTFAGTIIGFKYAIGENNDLIIAIVLAIVSGVSGSILFDSALKMLPDLLPMFIDTTMKRYLGNNISLFKTMTTELNNTESDNTDERKPKPK